MNHLILNFMAGALVSFLGSLPVGILNLTIMQISLQKGLKGALLFALACAIIELGYSYIAVRMSGALVDFAMYKNPIRFFSIALFLVAGIGYLRKKPSGQVVQYSLGPFSLGIVLSILNVMAIPFWLVYTAVLSASQWIAVDAAIEIAWFVTGISLGTLLGLMTFALLSRRIHKQFSLQSSLVNKVVGLILIGSSLLELIHLVN
ncbi:LysE family transporter [Rhodocytophaga rosea]|uniref:LysE family transporter n=1 Tax=Rhodocytophaga rosea TaxID=2704465 RepID=A0A6C0GUA3_9BACT|nr:LysE family transporter [Rhodocytophaga rosea]QHT71788.1 LysE family transporter [Rhodocytophaga rosea]